MTDSIRTRKQRMGTTVSVNSAVLKWIEFAVKKILNGLNEEKHVTLNTIKKIADLLPLEKKNGFRAKQGSKVIFFLHRSTEMLIRKKDMLMMLYIELSKRVKLFGQYDVNRVIKSVNWKLIILHMIKEKEQVLSGYANIAMNV